jgi:prepilin-type N-terminal cleavage/methylation domain-containing protein
MTRRPARAAFTLIELLVVISIITVITAITVGVFFRVRGNSQVSATDVTLSKVNTKLDQRVSAINAQVADDVKKNHPMYRQVLDAVGNPDLAKALWTYAKMKNELPMSFNEARTPTPVFGSVVLPPKAVFAALPAGAAGGTPEESAACLYLAVTANAGGGTVTETDGLDQQIGNSGLGGFKCFKDAWGKPIAFVRTVYNSEVNGPPIVPAGRTAFDPFDPRGKLPTLGGGLAGWWNALKPPVDWVAVPASYPVGANHVTTAISAGVNGQWWGPLGTPGAATDIYGLPPLPDSDAAKDNQLSYRLRREGARGD